MSTHSAERDVQVDQERCRSCYRRRVLAPRDCTDPDHLAVYANLSETRVLPPGVSS